MSPTTQTPPRIKRGGFVLAAMAVAAILALALGPNWRAILRLAEAAHPHLPSAAAIAAIPQVIAVHLAAALAAVALGAVLMLARKGRTFHRVAGWTWVGLVGLVAGSSLFITQLRPGHYSILHLLTGWTLIALPLAVVWARRREVARHRRFMMGLFYGGFAINIFFAFIPGRTLWMLVFG